MPMKPQHPCNYPGCKSLTSNRHCDTHAAMNAAATEVWRRERDGTTKQRGYSGAWKRLRLTVLARDPICMADGCTRPSTDADHIIAKRLGGPDTMENLQGLCKRCHSIKTNKEDGGWGRACRIVIGGGGVKSFK